MAHFQDTPPTLMWGGKMVWKGARGNEVPVQPPGSAEGGSRKPGTADGLSGNAKRGQSTSPGFKGKSQPPLNVLGGLGQTEQTKSPPVSPRSSAEKNPRSSGGVKSTDKTTPKAAPQALSFSPAMMLSHTLETIMAFDTHKAQYVQSVLHPVLSEMVSEAVSQMPLNPVVFFLAWLLPRLEGAVDVPDDIQKSCQPLTLWLNGQRRPFNQCREGDAKNVDDVMKGDVDNVDDAMKSDIEKPSPPGVLSKEGSSKEGSRSTSVQSTTASVVTGASESESDVPARMCKTGSIRSSVQSTAASVVTGASESESDVPIRMCKTASVRSDQSEFIDDDDEPDGPDGSDRQHSIIAELNSDLHAGIKKLNKSKTCPSSFDQDEDKDDDDEDEERENTPAVRNTEAPRRRSILKSSNAPSSSGLDQDLMKRRRSILKNPTSKDSQQKRRVSLAPGLAQQQNESEGLNDPATSSEVAMPTKRTRRKMSVYMPLPKIPVNEVRQVIANIPLFQNLLPKDLQALADAFEVRRFDPDEEIVRFGQQGGDLHVIYSGESRVSVPQQVGKLGFGECIGEQMLLKSHLTASTTVTSAPDGPLVTLSLSPEELTRLGLKKKLAEGSKKEKGKSDQKVVSRKKTEILEDLANMDGDGVVEKTDEIREMIKDSIRQNDQLVDILQLTPEMIEAMVDAMKSEEVESGRELTKAEEPGDRFYVVHDGVLEVTGGSTKSGHMGPGTAKLRSGDSFGELCLLYNTPWRQTVVATRRTIVWVLDRSKMRDINRAKRAERTKEYKSLLESVQNISGRLHETQMQLLAESLEEVLYLQDEDVVVEGEHGNTFYVIFDGKCQVSKKNAADFRKPQLGRGDYFGERALLTQEPRAATVTVASETATLLALEKTSFDLLLSSPLQSLWSAQKSKGQEFFNQRGSMEVVRAIIQRSSLVGDGSTTLSQAIRDDNDEHEATHVFDGELSDLTRRGVLGAGTFGLVTMEEDAQGTFYALKTISKGYIVEEGLQNMIVNERNAMQMLDSPFCVKLYATFKDEQFVYFLLEPVLGGELFQLYSENDSWFGREDYAQFYSCCAALGLEHVHSWKLVYRDLKLENVLLTDKGYAKLTDFGLAKVCVGKTYTVCGTADYFAPETLRQQGHNRAVDWWALGIMIFIMMSGRSPFDAEDVMAIYKNIVKGFKKETFPNNFSAPLIELIKSLCRKKPEERLPMGPSGCKAMREHPWFGATLWDSVRTLKAEPPYVPAVKAPKRYSEVELPGGMTIPMDTEAPLGCGDESMKYENDESGWDDDF